MRDDAYQAMQTLKSLRQKSKRIEAVQMRIAGCREMATRATASMSAANASGSGNRSKVETAVVSITDLQAQLEAIVAELRMDRYRIQKAINGMEDEEQKMLLEYRYIDCMSWGMVMEHMHISRPTSYRLHMRALINFHAAYKYETS